MAHQQTDVLLVGAGIMSATLGTMLKQLNPDWSIAIVERLENIAEESTSGWNNAGTGHAAYCELNYTSEKADGTIDTAKALKINRAFETSLQFWSYLVEQGAMPAPENFINPTPHMSFVWGDDNVRFLRKRYEALKEFEQFTAMEYSEDHAVLKEWMPLVMEGRDPGQNVAGTRVAYGSDVNFGAVTRSMIDYLQTHDDVELIVNHEVTSLKKQDDGRWQVDIAGRHSGDKRTFNAGFVFVGAGGGALSLLQKAGIDEVAGYAGFPVSGQWLVCRKPEIVERHWAKVYGKASIGSPPMSVPHLDTRIIGGEKALLFGPFAGFTTKFLKRGSWLDMLKSIRPGNTLPMVAVGLTSFQLVKYLVKEVMQNQAARMASLREYFPNAKDEDWTLAHAGQRVQIIKKDPKKVGKLEFGTEVLTTADGSLSALLGASPGASVAVPAMIELLEACFPEELATEGKWREPMKVMMESQGYEKGCLTKDVDLLRRVRKRNLALLKLG